MNVVWGILMLVIGLYIFISAILKSDYRVYKLLHARAKLIWKENTHTFLVIVGIIIICLSSLFFLGVWGN